MRRWPPSCSSIRGPEPFAIADGGRSLLRGRADCLDSGRRLGFLSANLVFERKPGR
jgi:hypothetical protein